MPEFTRYQRKMWTVISYLTVCRFYIDTDDTGKYIIKNTGPLRRMFYYVLWGNSFIKILYLILTYQGLLLEVHFLDQMSIWDWFLCFSQLVQEINLWYRKYPLYEVLHTNWVIQEEIFRKLGSPTALDQKIKKNDKGLVILHSIIVLGGCSALVIQFLSDPKYALFTYAIIPWDNWPLKILFACHEYLYMFHIWVHQATSIVLCEVFAVTYTNILAEMTSVLYQMIELGEEESSSDGINDNQDQVKNNINVSRKFSHNGELEGIQASIPQLPTVNRTDGEGKEDTQRNNSSKENIPKMKRKKLHPNTLVPGTEYNIMTLMADYEHLMLATDSFNKWVGKLMAGTNASNYGQFISDVFMMIQLLKEPDVDFFSVFFFFEDACAGMVMLFRMLILMSRMYPSSEEFLQAFKLYLTYDLPNKKYWLKYQKTLKIVAAKIGGYKTRPITVTKGVNALMNWYICAAMWQRPTDRRT